MRHHFAVLSRPRIRDATVATYKKAGMVDTSDLARQLVDIMPHAQALGVQLVSIGDGTARIRMPYDKKFVGDPKTGVIHGGAVSALMDTCCGVAVISHSSAPIATATIDLRIDYMRPAKAGQAITTYATCYHMTRSVAFVRATALDADESRPVAAASGAFTVER